MLSMNPLYLFSFEELGFYGSFGKNIQKYPFLKRIIISLETNRGYRLLTVRVILSLTSRFCVRIPLDQFYND